MNEFEPREGKIGDAYLAFARKWIDAGRYAVARKMCGIAAERFAGDAKLSPAAIAMTEMPDASRPLLLKLFTDPVSPKSRQYVTGYIYVWPFGPVAREKRPRESGVNCS